MSISPEHAQRQLAGDALTPRAAEARPRLVVPPCFAGARAVGCKDERLHAFVLMNERRVCEVCDERVLALDARVVDLGDLVRVEAAPLAAVEFLVESGQVVVRGEIDEGVPDIALVLEVDGEVQQVELALHRTEEGGGVEGRVGHRSGDERR
eukprot:scaffold31013_cov110-Isochrysis_galbana.AAC.7